VTPRRAWIALVLGVACSFGGIPESSRPRWQLVWHDEFDGTTLDAGKWVRETGGDGWGNAVLEFYTDRTENARIEGGSLIIEARGDTFGNRDYTSARLKTQGLGAWRYGRMEARIQIPRGQACGPPSGCWATTAPRSAGPRAARSTSWRTSASKAPSSIVPSSPAERCTRLRGEPSRGGRRLARSRFPKHIG